MTGHFAGRSFPIEKVSGISFQPSVSTPAKPEESNDEGFERLLEEPPYGDRYEPDPETIGGYSDPAHI
jgi:hypothetical protein